MGFRCSEGAELTRSDQLMDKGAKSIRSDQLVDKVVPSQPDLNRAYKFDAELASG